MPGTLTPTNPKLDAVYDVLIDSNGRFKYILCRVYDPDNKDQSKFIVRGALSAEFHSDIYDELDAQLEQTGLACECLGGGKIAHEAAQKSIEVSGKSQGYGKANHSMTVDILKAKFPDYISITWSDD